MPTSLAYISLLARSAPPLLLVLLRGGLSSLKKSIGGAAVPKRPEQQQEKGSRGGHAQPGEKSRGKRMPTACGVPKRSPI